MIEPTHTLLCGVGRLFVVRMFSLVIWYEGNYIMANNCKGWVCVGGVFSGITEYVYKKKSKTEFQSDVLINNGSSDIFVLN